MAQGCPWRSAAEIDLMDPVVQENWFEAYDILREQSPVYFMPQLGMYVLTGYEEIEYVLRRHYATTGNLLVRGDGARRWEGSNLVGPPGLEPGTNGL